MSLLGTSASTGASGRLAEWITVEPAPVVVIEGVCGGRSERAEHLAFVVWVETPAATRLARGLERDGDDAIDDWRDWMSVEDDHDRRDPTRERAGLVIDGTA